MLSVEAAHDRSTRVELTAVAVIEAGVLGGVVSGGGGGGAARL